jgi:hypothetical protein
VPNQPAIAAAPPPLSRAFDTPRIPPGQPKTTLPNRESSGGATSASVNATWQYSDLSGLTFFQQIFNLNPALPRYKICLKNSAAAAGPALLCQCEFLNGGVTVNSVVFLVQGTTAYPPAEALGRGMNPPQESTDLLLTYGGGAGASSTTAGLSAAVIPWSAAADQVRVTITIPGNPAGVVATAGCVFGLLQLAL